MKRPRSKRHAAIVSYPVHLKLENWDFDDLVNCTHHRGVRASAPTMSSCGHDIPSLFTHLR